MLLLDLVVVRCLVCVLGFTCAFVLGLLRWLVCLLLVLFCLSWFALPKLWRYALVWLGCVGLGLCCFVFKIGLYACFWDVLLLDCWALLDFYLWFAAWLDFDWRLRCLGD